MNHYELRTARGTPIMAYDDKQRAISECLSRSRKLGCKLSVWQVSRHEVRVA